MFLFGFGYFGWIYFGMEICDQVGTFFVVGVVNLLICDRMFYSQTFLGRKGPLGTVWCAAHLQHRLKKSHYTSTNIPKTVGESVVHQLHSG